MSKEYDRTYVLLTCEGTVDKSCKKHTPDISLKFGFRVKKMNI